MIFVDFNNRDASGFLRLNTVGTINDLSSQSIILEGGLKVTVTDGDLMAKIVVHQPGIEGVWRGEIIAGPTECE